MNIFKLPKAAAFFKPILHFSFRNLLHGTTNLSEWISLKKSYKYKWFQTHSDFTFRFKLYNPILTSSNKFSVYGLTMQQARSANDQSASAKKRSVFKVAND